MDINFKLKRKQLRHTTTEYKNTIEIVSSDNALNFEVQSTVGYVYFATPVLQCSIRSLRARLMYSNSQFNQPLKANSKCNEERDN